MHANSCRVGTHCRRQPQILRLRLRMTASGGGDTKTRFLADHRHPGTLRLCWINPSVGLECECKPSHPFIIQRRARQARGEGSAVAVSRPPEPDLLIALFPHCAPLQDNFRFAGDSTITRSSRWRTAFFPRMERVRDLHYAALFFLNRGRGFSDHI